MLMMQPLELLEVQDSKETVIHEVAGISLDGLTDFRLNPPHLFPERKLYSVRLIAVNDCGRDTIFKSIDLRPNGTHDIAQISDLQCFPNPFDDALSVQFYVSEPSTIRFELYDVAGRLVEILSQS